MKNSLLAIFLFEFGCVANETQTADGGMSVAQQEISPSKDFTFEDFDGDAQPRTGCPGIWCYPYQWSSVTWCHVACSHESYCPQITDRETNRCAQECATRPDWKVCYDECFGAIRHDCLLGFGEP